MITRTEGTTTTYTQRWDAENPVSASLRGTNGRLVGVTVQTLTSTQVVISIHDAGGNLVWRDLPERHHPVWCLVVKMRFNPQSRPFGKVYPLSEADSLDRT